MTLLLRCLTVTTLLAATPSLLSGQDAADPADVESVDAVMTALYEVVNRPPGEPYDWDRMVTLFLPEARLVPNVEQTAGDFMVLSPREFANWIDGMTDPSDPADPGFQEEEIARRVDRFGDVAQVLSTYQKRYWGEDEILGRGINAINLVHNDGRWWVASIVWDEGVGAGPIPERYLPGGG